MKMDMAPSPPILRSATLAAGTGAPVLLLHGSASAAVMWVPVIDGLKSRFRVIAPDLIGYGRTDSWPDGYAFTVDDELHLVEPLLAHAPAPVHVVGHSFGGVVALHLALAGRVPIRSLTLIEPVAFFLLPHAGAQAAWLETQDLGQTYAARVAAGQAQTALRGFIDYWAGAGAWDAMDASLRAQIARSAQKIVLDFEVTFTDPGMPAIRALECPVHLISGGRSRIPTQRIAAFLAEQIPGATLEIVADANHLLPVTHADVLRAHLLRELAD
jgi:pimeloyl-ACP methyl ester carboxylesterase